MHVYQRAQDRRKPPSVPGAVSGSEPGAQGSPLLPTLPPALAETPCERGCSIFLQNSSDPVAVSAAELLGGTSLENYSNKLRCQGLEISSQRTSDFHKMYRKERRGTNQQNKTQKHLEVPNEPG